MKNQQHVSWSILTTLLFACSCCLVAAQTPEDAVKTATAEADRLDPGWRWQDLMKRRPVVRDEENAVLILREVNRLLPQGQAREYLETSCAEITQRPVPDRLSAVTVEFFQKELDRVKPALQEARKFARCKLGRYPGEFLPTFEFDKQPDKGGNPREFTTVMSLLEAEGAVLLNEGKTAEALANLKAMFVMARCLDDNPFLIGYLMCIACHQQPLRFLERFLARADLDETILADLQKLIHDERLQPRFLRVMRGERAFTYEQSHSFKPSNFAAPEELGWWQKQQWQWQAYQFMVLSSAQTITHQTAFIEWLKDPSPAHEKRLRALEEANEAEMQKMRDGDMLARPWGHMMILNKRSGSSMITAYQRHQTFLGCAELAIAIERHRLHTGKWPNTLKDIPKEILPSIPPDPYLPGHMLRMSRSPYRLMVYSVGPDQEDNDGLLLKGQSFPGMDLGMTLWSERIKGPKGKPEK